jgi:hypothetical protein
VFLVATGIFILCWGVLFLKKKGLWDKIFKKKKTKKVEDKTGDKKDGGKETANHETAKDESNLSLYLKKRSLPFFLSFLLLILS